ncbi:hypothetical protein OCU04_005216 [Sclerotinia nivalis]|uniref:Uncharacterized protein n=1 Tax=Sclerotinia nivalis TaxID=352851 RepID=A0A9X0ANN3_9HELO|nr:hypothetical protein OCU04_005216 [Sclerotinia nivalis]
MEDSFEAPKGSLSQRSPLPLPNNHRSTVPSYSLRSPASDIPININNQQTSVSIPVSLDARGKASNPTKNTVASMAAMTGPLTAHDEGDSHSTNDNATQQTAPKCNNPLDLNFKETGSGFAKSTSSTPSEHSSGSDAAFYCSVGSPSEEDVSSTSLCRTREAEPATSMPVRVPTSASAPDVFDGSVVEGEVETRERRGMKVIAQQTSEKTPMFLKRLLNRNKSKRDSKGGV